MNLFQALILGLIQGLTEFIPVSSSGHLAIVPYLLNWPNPSLVFDVALHAGTLLALIWFFRSKIWSLMASLIPGIQTRGTEQSNRRLIFRVLVATIPAGIVGWLMQDTITALYKSDNATTLRTAIIYTSLALIAVGTLFVLADRYLRQPGKEINKLTIPAALAIGIAQALALFRGVSRSGITLLTGQLVGLKRVDAAEFAFLMSIPIMTLTTIFGIQDLLSLSSFQASSELPLLIIGLLSAFISGLIAINFLLRFLRRHGLAMFGWYRIIFGALVLLLVIK